MKIHIFVFLIKKGKFFIKSYENVRKRQEYHQKKTLIVNVYIIKNI